MEWTKVFCNTTLSVLIPIVVALIAASVTWQIAAKRIVIENITQERAKWREKVRKRALLVHDAMIKRNGEDLDRYRSEFRALLNPQDCEDMGIVRCIELPQQGGELEQAKGFSKRIALLLKHDWERAKHEAKTIHCRCKPKREPYRECSSNGDATTGDPGRTT